MKRSPASYNLEFERFLAARWAGLSVDEFTEKEGSDQAMIIAAYRIENRILALEAQEARKRLNARSS